MLLWGFVEFCEGTYGGDVFALSQGYAFSVNVDQG